MASQVDPNAKTGEAQGCPVNHGKGMPSGMPNPHHGIIFGGVQTGSGSHQYGPGDQIQDPNKPVKHDTQPGQEGLSTVSIPSTIPRANSDATWNYPSQQRFYNAMKKKGYNPQAEDVPTVVKIHNSVNEQCWREVMEFEKMHGGCIAPKLKHFQGRPRDFSPKARFWAFVGYKLPFDRHDWVIDRCGKEVRYVLDYYQGPEKDGAPASIYLDIRPALDSVGAGMDRVKMGLKKMFGGNDSKQTQQ